MGIAVLSPDPKWTDPIQQAHSQPQAFLNPADTSKGRGNSALNLMSLISHRGMQETGKPRRGHIVLLLTVDALEQKHDFAKLTFIACT